MKMDVTDLERGKMGNLNWILHIQISPGSKF